MRIVNIDLKKYMIYENKSGELYAAIDIKNQELMNQYYHDYRFKSAPGDLVIEGYEIIPDDNPNTYKVDENRKRKFKVNELRYTWTRTS